MQDSGALGSASGGTIVSHGATLKLKGNGIHSFDALTLDGGGGALRSDGVDGFSINQVEGIALSAASRINTSVGTLEINGDITGANQNLFLGGLGATLVLGGVKTGAGSVTVDGGGLVQFYGANSYTGTTYVANGRLEIYGDGDRIGDGSALLVGATGKVSIFGAETVGSIAGAGQIVLSAALTVGGAYSWKAFSGVVSDNGSGAGSLVKTGLGVLYLSGANAYGGGTTVNGGTLAVQNVGANSATASLGSGSVSVAAGAKLSIVNNDAVASGAAGCVSLNNFVSGAGSVVYGGAANNVTTVDSNNAYTGANPFSRGLRATRVL